MIKDYHFPNVDFACRAFLNSVRFLLMHPVYIWPVIGFLQLAQSFNQLQAAAWDAPRQAKVQRARRGLERAGHRRVVLHARARHRAQEQEPRQRWEEEKARSSPSRCLSIWIILISYLTTKRADQTSFQMLYSWLSCLYLPLVRLLSPVSQLSFNCIYYKI